jgi:predicted RNase H-like nuclease (RuvC/YqgF family)
MQKSHKVPAFEERLKRVEEALQDKADLQSKLEELPEEVDDLRSELADAESRIDDLENGDWT